MSKAKQPVGKLKSSPSSNVSSVKFLKTFAPSIRRRRQCDKEKLEIYNLETTNNENFNVWDAIPASPITPPAAFFSGYRRSGKKSPWEDDFTFTSSLNNEKMQMLDEGDEGKGADLVPFCCYIEIFPHRHSLLSREKKNEKINPRNCAASWNKMKKSRLSFRYFGSFKKVQN